MVIYYKATRPDGMDFRTGTVDYVAALASGESLPLLTSPDGVYKCCTDTVYHASDVPSETLIGCIWPCRLFEVEGEPVAQEGRKFGFRTMRVVREIEAHRALGPNGEVVVRLIDQAANLTGAQRESISAARGAAWSAARSAARSAAEDEARHAARSAAWHAARSAAGDAAWRAARGAAGDAAWDAAWGAAWRAAQDAAGALVVRDLITEDESNILYGPWVSVMGGEK